MQPAQTQLTFPFRLLVLPPLGPICVFVFGELASQVGAKVNVYTRLGVVVLVAFGITFFIALVAELYAAPVAIKALVCQRPLRTVRNFAAAAFGGVCFVGGLAWLFLLRFGNG